MQDQLASRLAWIDKLHEVGDPILRRRSAVLEMNEQAQRMEREARALRGRATGACLGLIDAVIQNWTSEEIARAQAAAPKTGRPGASSMPLLLADARSERLVWETLLHLAGDAPGASALAERYARMRTAIDLALIAFDTMEARNPLRGVASYNALQAMYGAVGRPWPAAAS